MIVLNMEVINTLMLRTKSGGRFIGTFSFGDTVLIFIGFEQIMFLVMKSAISVSQIKFIMINVIEAYPSHKTHPAKV